MPKDGYNAECETRAAPILRQECPDAAVTLLRRLSALVGGEDAIEDAQDVGNLRGNFVGPGAMPPI